MLPMRFRSIVILLACLYRYTCTLEEYLKERKPESLNSSACREISHEILQSMYKEDPTLLNGFTAQCIQKFPKSIFERRRPYFPYLLNQNAKLAILVGYEKGAFCANLGPLRNYEHTALRSLISCLKIIPPDLFEGCENLPTEFYSRLSNDQVLAILNSGGIDLFHNFKNAFQSIHNLDSVALRDQYVTEVLSKQEWFLDTTMYSSLPESCIQFMSDASFTVYLSKIGSKVSFLESHMKNVTNKKRLEELLPFIKYFDAHQINILGELSEEHYDHLDVSVFVEINPDFVVLEKLNRITMEQFLLGHHCSELNLDWNSLKLFSDELIPFLRVQCVFEIIKGKAPEDDLIREKFTKLNASTFRNINLEFIPFEWLTAHQFQEMQKNDAVCTFISQFDSFPETILRNLNLACFRRLFPNGIRNEVTQSLVNPDVFAQLSPEEYEIGNLSEEQFSLFQQKGKCRGMNFLELPEKLFPLLDSTGLRDIMPLEWTDEEKQTLKERFSQIPSTSFMNLTRMPWDLTTAEQQEAFLSRPSNCSGLKDISGMPFGRVPVACYRFVVAEAQLEERENPFSSRYADLNPDMFASLNGLEVFIDWTSLTFDQFKGYLKGSLRNWDSVESEFVESLSFEQVSELFEEGLLKQCNRLEKFSLDIFEHDLSTIFKDLSSMSITQFQKYQTKHCTSLDITNILPHLGSISPQCLSKLDPEQFCISEETVSLINPEALSALTLEQAKRVPSSSWNGLSDVQVDALSQSVCEVFETVGLRSKDLNQRLKSKFSKCKR